MSVIVRTALALALLVLATLPLAQAQPPGGKMVIGRLSPLSAATDAPNLGAFRRGLGDLGWIEGQHFTIEARFADGHPERLAELATDLVRRRVHLILVGSTPGARAAKQATATIPIVMVTTGDPVADALVTSLARPGGNVTGLTALGHALSAKRLEALKGAVTGLTRVGVLVNPVSPSTAPFLRERDAAARTLGLQLRTIEARDAGQLDAAFAALAAERVGGLMVLSDVMFIAERRTIVNLAARHRMPAVYGEREFVEDGGLMFYGASLTDTYRRAAVYADRILKGARPADLPIEQPTRLELIVNQRAARTLGLAFPPALLLRADRVIE